MRTSLMCNIVYPQAYLLLLLVLQAKSWSTKTTKTKCKVNFTPDPNYCLLSESDDRPPSIRLKIYLKTLKTIQYR